MSQGNAQNEFSDSFPSFPASQMANPSQANTRHTISGTPRTAWTDLTLGGEQMSRFSSQDSVGAHSQRTTHSSLSNSYDQTGSVNMYPSVSQMSFHISSARSDATGRSHSPDNSALYTPTQQLDLQAFDSFPYSAGEDTTGEHTLYHRDSNISLTSGQSYGLYTTADDTFASVTDEHLPVSHDGLYNPIAAVESPTLWEQGPNYLDSQRSSPALEEWTLPAPQMTTSTNNSPLDYSPSLEAISPRYVQDFPDMAGLPPYASGDRIVRKSTGPRQSKVVSDLASRNRGLTGTSEASDESLRFVGRSSLEIDNTARDHPLYQNVTAQADGLYHCPWEGQPSCQHKPEKLKCNYEYDPFLQTLSYHKANHMILASKFVDSHLKPYRCKVIACENSRFSSTACLLRHEREAHAMHGHGDKPYLCTYEGCERGATGNGFPRHWNLRDHMRRVHNDPGPAKSNASGSPPPQASGTARGKNKRKADTTDPPAAEKALKRIATPPVVRQPQEPSMIDRWHTNGQQLLETIKQLNDPRNADTMALLRNASDHIKVMAQTTQRIQIAPTAMGRNFSQQSSG